MSHVCIVQRELERSMTQSSLLSLYLGHKGQGYGQDVIRSSLFSEQCISNKSNMVINAALWHHETIVGWLKTLGKSFVLHRAHSG